MLTQHNQKHNELLWLAQYIKPYRLAMCCIAILVVGVAATEPMFAMLMKPLLDQGFARGGMSSPDLLWQLPLGIMAIFIARGIFSFCSNYGIQWVTNNMLRDLRTDMFSHLLRLPDSQFKQYNTAFFMAKVTNDAGAAVQSAAQMLLIAVRETLMLFALLGFLLYLNWKLTIIAIVAVGLSAAVAYSLGRTLKALASRAQVGNVELINGLMESIEGQRLVKLHNAYKQETDVFAGIIAKLRRISMRLAVPNALSMPSTQIIASAAVAIVVALALYLNQNGADELTVGGFMAFITAMLQMLAPLKALASLNGQLAGVTAAVGSLQQFANLPIEADTYAQHASGSMNTTAGIEFVGVTVQYPNSEKPALDCISLHIPHGQVVALVGASGGGKSTLAGVIPRFIEPSAGQVRVGGVLLNEIPLQTLRSQIAMVTQETVLFDRSVYDNVAYGSTTPEDEGRVWAALEAAALADTVRGLPQGVHTLIGEGGKRLSGGQRQRLAIARAFYKNAPILILDEATSALDTQTEKHIAQAMSTLIQGRTCVVIAHRLSTIENADSIVVIEQGKAVEQGTHTALMQKKGRYAKLHGKGITP